MKYLHRQTRTARPFVAAACRALILGLALAAPGLLADPATPSPSDLRRRASGLVSALPAKAPRADKDTPALIELGRALYFEERLSKNNSQSCNTCHAVDRNRSGVDNMATSLGAFGERGGRNSPTVLNAAFAFSQFWDGRAATLEDQAKGPILNPVEMGMPDQTVVIGRLKEDAKYPAAFAKAFPDNKDPVTYDNLARAIAAFERTLITRDRVDAFLHGNDSALSASAQRGMHTFLTVGCAICHQGPILGGTSYQKLGLVEPFPGIKDKGRFEVTKDPEDLHKFKVPTLRNIAVTGPYLHNGSVKTLNEMVRIMARYQLGLTLSAEQEADLVAFLNSLTGEGIVAAKQ